MKIGITLTPHSSTAMTPREGIENCLWAAKYADEHGFDVIWTTEHHFLPVSFSSAPSLLLTQYASITNHAQLGYAAAIVPLHHPVRLAEEMAWVDHFSKGRLIAGVSQGWSPMEFRVMGVDIDDRHELFEEGFAIIRKALAGGRFSHDGKYWKIKDVEVLPNTFQAGGPKFVVATSSEAGVRTAARLRASPIVGFPPNDQLIAFRNAYIDTARAEGIPDGELSDLLTRFGSLRRIVVRDTDEEAEEVAIDGARSFGPKVKSQPIEGILRRLPQPEEKDDPRKLFAYIGTIWGSPETVVRKLLELKDTGLGQIVIQFHLNTEDPASTRENIRRFSTEVLPVYRAESNSRDSRATSKVRLAS